VKSRRITPIARSWLARRRPLPPPSSPIAIRSGERVVWSGTGHPRSMILFALALTTAAPLAVGFVAGRRELLLVACVMAGTWLLVDRVRVTVGPYGIRASMGMLGWPRISLPIDEILQSSTLDVRPSRWGGWGYRGSLTVIKRSAMILRSGEGIRVDLTDGRVFVVSVDDASTGASVLQGAVERHTLARERSTPSRDSHLRRP
jgi:hypothetical protein